MPADLPALTKLTEDVVAAMHTAQRREHRRHASRLRRGFPLMAIMIALLIPAGLALHAGPASSDAQPPDHGHAYEYATAAGACTAGAVVVAAAGTRATAPGCTTQGNRITFRCTAAASCR